MSKVKRGCVEMCQISSEEMKADFFAKIMVPQQFKSGIAQLQLLQAQ